MAGDGISSVSPAASHWAARVRPVGARDGDPQSAVGPGDETAQGHLEQRRLRGVPDQPVGQLGGRAVEGAGPRDAEVGEARSASVLDGGQRSGADDLESRHAGTSRTRVPGASSAGESDEGSHRLTVVVPSSRQPPGEAVG